MKRRPAQLARPLENPVLVGWTTILVTLVAVFLSYTAQDGLPYLPSYLVAAEVPNGDELVRDADVRIGGTRIGLVLSITPEPATLSHPSAVARVVMRLDRSAYPLPADSRAGLRISSILGGKYVEIVPGRSRRTILDGGTIPASQAFPLVDIDQALSAFGQFTAHGIRGLMRGAGDAVAGRGSSLNDSIASLATLLPPLQRVLDALGAPPTDLAGLIRGTDEVMSALAPVSYRLPDLLGDGATTLEALLRAGDSLARTIDVLPDAETVATRSLLDSQPALADAAAVARALRPGARLLVPAAQQLNGLITAATPVFAQAPALTGPLRDTLAAVGRLAADRAARQGVQLLLDPSVRGANDLATFSASGFFGLGAILKAGSAGQFHCNIEVPWLVNFASTISEGDATGTWLRTMEVYDPAETFAAPTAASTLHENPYPHENATECEAGNEPYAAGQLIGNPPGVQQGYQATAQPPGVAARAATAGLEGGR